jgi:hypothetical protein
MWPFKRKPIVDGDTAQWHVDNFAWLAATFGGNGAFADSVLVLPKSGFFPSEGQEGHARALHILERVKYYCGMDDWPADLVPDHNPAADRSSRSVATPVHGKHAQGTLSVKGNTIQISYVPALPISAFARSTRVAILNRRRGLKCSAIASERPYSDTVKRDGPRHDHPTCLHRALHFWREVFLPPGENRTCSSSY